MRPLEPLRPIACARLVALAATLGLSSCASIATRAVEGPRVDDRDAKDTSEGIDPDGRIPKVEFPAHIQKPERWRYLPEGRIIEGSIFDRLYVTSFAVPIFFFTSDVGAGGGLSLTDIDFGNNRRREFATTTLTYTTEGQQNYSVIWRRWLNHLDLEGGGVIQEERSFVGAFAGYQKTLTRRFFGIGPDTDEDDETSYTDEITAAAIGLEHSLPEPESNWVGTLGARVESRNLSRGFVGGVPDTRTSFTGLFDEGDGLASLWVNAGLRYDTRDSQKNPYSGWTLGVWGEAAPLISGGRSGTTFGVDGRAVLALPSLLHDGGDENEENPPTDVFAVTAQIEGSGGELPFWALPSLGGKNRLRGYIANRWTDEAAWFAAAEYRIVLIPRGFAVSKNVRVERVGLALFYELGAVAPSIGSLADSKTRDSVGIGIRLGLERAANFRFDFGFSDEGSNLSIVFGLSF